MRKLPRPLGFRAPCARNGKRDFLVKHRRSFQETHHGQAPSGIASTRVLYAGIASTESEPLRRSEPMGRRRRRANSASRSSESKPVDAEVCDIPTSQLRLIG